MFGGVAISKVNSAQIQMLEPGKSKVVPQYSILVLKEIHLLLP